MCFLLKKTAHMRKILSKFTNDATETLNEGLDHTEKQV